jgi:hypothetical protein
MCSGDGNGRISAERLAEEIGVIGVGESEPVIDQGAVPGGNDEPVARGFLQKYQRVQAQRGVEEKLCVVKAQAGLEMIVDEFDSLLLRPERPLPPGLAEQPLAQKQAEVDYGQLNRCGDLPGTCSRSVQLVPSSVPQRLWR